MTAKDFLKANLLEFKDERPMKIYDAVAISQEWEDAQEKDNNHICKYGPWQDDIGWKSLMYGDEQYTHVRTNMGLFKMTKWGPGDEAVEP